MRIILLQSGRVLRGKLGLLAVVPLAYRAEITDNAGVDLGRGSALGTNRAMTAAIAVRRTYRKRRREGEIGQAVVLQSAYKPFHCFGIGSGLAQEHVQHGAAGVLGLEAVLEVQNVEDVIAVVDRQVRGVAVEGTGAGVDCRLIGA